MICPKCKSENVNVNGIFWHCQDCDAMDDSTFEQIMEECEKVEDD